MTRKPTPTRPARASFSRLATYTISIAATTAAEGGAADRDHVRRR